MQFYYLHHAGGLPCVPRNLRAALRTGDSVTRPRLTVQGVNDTSEERLVTHLAAVDRYVPCDHDVPDVQVRVLYATRGPLVVPHEALRWESLGWADLHFNTIESSSHLFHTEIVGDSEERRWKSFVDELRSETNPESRRWLQ